MMQWIRRRAVADAARAASLSAVMRDDGCGYLMRALAWAVLTYRQAPLRELLIGPEGLWALDGILVGVLVRSTLWMADRRDRPDPIVVDEPPSSGWTGSLLFLLVWSMPFVALRWL